MTVVAAIPKPVGEGCCQNEERFISGILGHWDSEAADGYRQVQTEFSVVGH